MTSIQFQVQGIVIAILISAIFLFVVTEAQAVTYVYTDTQGYGELQGGNNGDYYGEEFNATGDLNGDGYDDLIIAGTGYSESEETYSFGRVGIYYGSADDTPFSGTTTWAGVDAYIEGDTSGSYFGREIVTGDLNGDGYDELIIGSVYNSIGLLYVYYGSATPFSGELGSADAIFYATNADGALYYDGGYSFGNSASVGDINDDGYDDLLTSDPEIGSYAGEAYLFYGQSSQYSGAISARTADAMWRGTTGDSLGEKVDATGDITGDGITDLVIGARNANESKGEVYVFLGSTGTPYSTDNIDPDTASTTFTHSGTNARSGDSFHVIGDADGDGFDDILYGYSAASYQNYREGGGYLIYGSNTLASSITIDTEYDALFHGTSVYEYAGAYIGSGDVNGDGYTDFYFSSSTLENNDGDSVGGVYFYYGSATRFSGINKLDTADITMIGEESFSLSHVLSKVGDVNGDGKDEFITANPYAIVGEINPGALYILYHSDDVPTASEVSGVSAVTQDTSPEYVLTSDIPGALELTGSCSSSTSLVEPGENTISITADVSGTILTDGQYTDCAFEVFGYWGGSNGTVSMTGFTVDTGSPTITALSPVDGAEEIAVDSNITMTFSESVTVNTGNITITNLHTGEVAETIAVDSDSVTGSGTTVLTINPETDLNALVEYSVSLPNALVQDSVGNYSYAVGTIPEWSFTTVGTAGVSISSESDSLLEGEATTYSVALDTQPSADVVVSFELEGDITTSLEEFAFTNTNWNIPQEFTVTATDNSTVAESEQEGEISVSITSEDKNYSAAFIDDTIIQIEEDDVERTEVVSFERQENGQVSVSYDNGDIESYTLFSISGKPKVKLHTNGDIFIAINKRYMRTFNAYTGEQIDQVKLFKNKQNKTKFKRYNIYKKKAGQNNVMVLAQSNANDKTVFKIRSFVVKNRGVIVRRNIETITLEKELSKFKNLNTKKNKKFGKNARIRVTRKGKKVDSPRYAVTKKKGRIQIVE